MATLASRKLLQNAIHIQRLLEKSSRWSCRGAQSKPSHIRHYAAVSIIPRNTHSRDFIPPAVRPKSFVEKDPNYTMPPDHPAAVARLTTFILPDCVTGNKSDIELGREMVNSWRKDGIFQIVMDSSQQHAIDEAFPASQAYFRLPFTEKVRNVDSQSFGGYIASGEELTDGILDYAEIFTITKDLPMSNPRVQARWPC